MSKAVQKYNIKIPNDIKAIYYKKKQILTFIGPTEIKSKKLKVKIFINRYKKIISVSPIFFSQSSNTEKRKIQMIQNTTVSQIKYMLIESSILLYKKLKINGIGYRANFTENFNQKLLTFKLGYSHFIYLQTLNNIIINCLTRTKLCISGNSYENVSHISAKIRINKVPDPYKGKGILYDNEIVKIKEGKKI